MGIPIILTTTGAGSDANILNTRGIESINLATGYEKAHSIDEYIKVEELNNVTRYVLSIIETVTNL